MEVTEMILHHHLFKGIFHIVDQNFNLQFLTNQQKISITFAIH